MLSTEDLTSIFRPGGHLREEPSLLRNHMSYWELASFVVLEKLRQSEFQGAQILRSFLHVKLMGMRRTCRTR